MEYVHQVNKSPYADRPTEGLSFSPEDRSVLIGVLSILTNHFILAAESGGGGAGGGKEDAIEMSTSDKAALERLLYRWGLFVQRPILRTYSTYSIFSIHFFLYRLVDQPSLPEDVSRSVRRCVEAGVSHLLLSPLRERLSRACALLHCASPSAGQELNLRLLLKSLESTEVGGFVCSTLKRSAERLPLYSSPDFCGTGAAFASTSERLRRSAEGVRRVRPDQEGLPPDQDDANRGVWEIREL